MRAGAAIALSLVVAAGCGSTTKTYEDQQLGWTIRYPSGFHQRGFAFGSRLYVEGVTIANFGRLAAEPASVTRTAPDDGVALQVFHREGGPAPDLSQAESRFPIRLADFEAARGLLRGDGVLKELSFRANGIGFTALAWVGARASKHDRSALAAIVASLRFPSLAEGTIVGDGFYVLGRPSAYPSRSVTRYDRTELPQSKAAWRRPFYLVHAPGGFYTIGWPSDRANGYKATCGVRFDPRSFEFACPNGARWDRLGRVIVGPGAGTKPNEPLDLYATSVSPDDHVLVSENQMGPVPPRSAGSLWPELAPPRRPPLAPADARSIAPRIEARWLRSLRGLAKRDSHTRFSNPSELQFRARLRQAQERFGFEVVHVRLVRPLQTAPLVVVRAADPHALARAAPAILRLIDPRRPSTDDREGWAYEGFFFEAVDSRDVPFLIVFNNWRGDSGGGGQWATDESLYPFAHG